MKKITWKQALWFVLAFSLLSAMYKSIEPLLPLDISDEAKKPFSNIVDITDRQINKNYELSQKEIDSRIKSYTKWKVNYLKKFLKV